MKTEFQKESPNLKTIFDKKPSEETAIQEQVVSTLEDMNEPVSQEGVDKVLSDYIEAKSPLPTVKIVLSKKGTLLPSNQIELKIFNKIEVDTIKQIEPELLEFIRKRLRNTSVGISYRVVEAGSSERRPYTSSEIFEAMAKKNPSVLKLKEILGLDTDY